MQPTDPDQEININPGPDATGADLHRAGLAYSTGQGAPLSYIEAHKWFNLAALAGVQEAKVYRREISELMSSAEIAAAQEGARQWMTAAIRGGRQPAKPAQKTTEIKQTETKTVEVASTVKKKVPAKRAAGEVRTRIARVAA